MTSLPDIKIERDTALPVYRQIERQLATLITQGALTPNQQMPSVPALVAHLGINYQTIRQAYQALARKGMLRIVNGRGTFVADKTLTPALRTIGLVNFTKPDETLADSTFASLIHQGITQQGAKAGLEFRYFESFHKMILDEPERNMGGYIIQALRSGTEDMLTECQRMGIRAITLGGDGRLFPQVRADDHAGMAMLMQHLLDLGHRRIAILNVPIDNYSAHRRFNAYLQTMAQNDLDIHPTWICTAHQHTHDNTDQQERIFDQLMQSSRPPSAIIACGSTLTMSLLQVLHRHNIAVPRDLSICGYDDFKQLSLVSPPITTIRQPLIEMGRAVVRGLLAQMTGQPHNESILPVELVIRQSTAPPP